MLHYIIRRSKGNKKNIVNMKYNNEIISISNQNNREHIAKLQQMK